MAEWTSEQRLKGMAYANRLDVLALKAPDPHTEHITHELAREIRKRFTYSPELRKKELMVHIRKHDGNGGISIPELMAATGYEKNVVYTLVRDLETSDVIKRQATVRPVGRGRPGQVRLFLTNKAIFSVSKT